jgi:hypothetical protein
MKSLFCSIALLLGSLSGLAEAQVTVPQSGQFFPQFLETFEINPGATTQFPGLPPLGTSSPNAAIFTGLPVGGILIKSQNVQMLPPLRGQTCLFGRGTDVTILLIDPMRRFGGFFSRTNVAGAPTAVQFDFWLGGIQYGTSGPIPLPATGGPGTSAYVGLFFDLFPFGGYDRVDIRGIGGVFPANLGFVGMDDVMASQI